MIQITNSTFINCNATAGGAVYINSELTNYSIFITSTSFYNCNAFRGGAILVEGTNVVFADQLYLSNNSASSVGGSIGLNGNAQLSLTNSQIFYSQSTSGGGIDVTGNATLSANNVVFIGNIAASTGGGVSQDTSTSTISVVNSNFFSNQALSGSAIQAACSQDSLSNLTVINNQASSTGAIFFYNPFDGNCGCSNCIFSNNSATYGPDQASPLYSIDLINSPPSSFSPGDFISFVFIAADLFHNQIISSSTQILVTVQASPGYSVIGSNSR